MITLILTLITTINKPQYYPLPVEESTTFTTLPLHEELSNNAHLQEQNVETTTQATSLLHQESKSSQSDNEESEPLESLQVIEEPQEEQGRGWINLNPREQGRGWINLNPREQGRGWNNLNPRE